MAPTGRKPKPAAQRKREGKAGHRPIREAWTARGAPPPPEWLGEVAREFWLDEDELIQQLDRVGVLDVTDGPVLVALALAWERLVTAYEVLDAEGWAMRGSTGQVTKHPMLDVVQEASRTILSIAADLGATPSARTRIDREKAGGPVEPFADLPPSKRLRAIAGGRADA